MTANVNLRFTLMDGFTPSMLVAGISHINDGLADSVYASLPLNDSISSKTLLYRMPSKKKRWEKVNIQLP
jgi:hypothetical protein